MHAVAEVIIGITTRICIAVGVFLALVSAAWADDDNVAMTAKSLIARKCLSCHSGEEAKGKLDVSSREALLAGGESGPALVASSTRESQMWQRIERDEMPPKHPLSADEKKSIADWITAGATWPGGNLDPLALTTGQRAGLDWWSLQSLKPVPIPRAPSLSASRQPIDSFISERLTAEKMAMSPEAERRVLIRRLAFDLIGLPPNPDDVDRFVNDDRPDACERLVDELLASPHYGERWARHWLDVVRFGESNGFERDLPRPNAWYYRDWVLKALNRDLPYDDFVRWQLAGDLLAPDNADAIKSVGFLVAGAHDTVVPVVDRMRAMMRQDELEDIVGTVGQTFLGLTVNCARCHDHKFDPIPTREYYQLASALSGIDHGEREFTPPEVVSRLRKLSHRIGELSKVILDQETPIRQAILDGRSGADQKPVTPLTAPTPLAAWDFTRDLRDQLGDQLVTLVGNARRTDEGLIVDSVSFGMSAPMTRDILEKTLEVRLRLKTLQQSGGGAISLQTLNGNTFDAIVFAEHESARWMPGSNGFQRTLPFQAPAEESADREAVVMTQVHRADGTILGYRNGQPYGRPIRKDAAVRYKQGMSRVLFGLRHGTEVGGNRSLDGLIIAAKLYDKALTPDEVSASANSRGSYVSEAEIASQLTEDERLMRRAHHSELARLRLEHADLTANGPLKIYSAIATQPPAMKIHKRGSVSSLGEEVEPAGLAAVQGLSPGFDLRPDAIESHRRLRLANWITDARNPLFARVMVNRVWHYHFGTGLVESPNDLGFHAGMPSHPELLEWLASEFSNTRTHPLSDSRLPTVDRPGRFSLKRLHRLMVNSATYRQSSKFDSAAAAVDAGNRLLWRMPLRRLEAESVRDAMLVVSGELNTEIGGKGYTDVNSYFFKGTQFYDPIDPVGYTNHRRTFYRMGARGGRSPFLDTFDCPDPSTTTPRRSATVTPLQALSLLNHSFSLRMADRFAIRLSGESLPNGQANATGRADISDGHSVTDARIVNAFRLLYGRRPDREELELSRTLVASRGLSEFCRAMWNSSEFLYVD